MQQTTSKTSLHKMKLTALSKINKYIYVIVGKEKLFVWAISPFVTMFSKAILLNEETSESVVCGNGNLKIQDM